MRPVRVLVATVLVSLAVVADVPRAASQESAQEQRLIDAACSIPPLLLERTLRGYRPDRAPEIQVLTQEPDFLGHSAFPHSGPWDYVGEVPLFWYGPDQVPAVGEVNRRVTLADIAPTQGRLVGFDFDAPDGSVLREVIRPPAERPEPPALLVVLVWDGAGTHVIGEYPDAWPNLRSLIDDGVWYTRAEVGSSPPSTAQIHATIGTGAFSGTHGVTAHHFRMGERVVKPWELGPRYLMLPTFADLYDRKLGNRPLVGTSATVAIHLGMMSHGGLWGGGDRDLAVLRELEGATTLGAEGVSWNLAEGLRRWYRYPSYANDLPPLSHYFDEVDRADGRLDGTWLGTEIASEGALGGFHTPARVAYQDRLVEEMIEREGFGDDEVTDLLFVNHKLIDEIGHKYSMNSPEMEDSIRTEDAVLPGLIDILNREVGEGRWVITITADHGHTPDPDVSGAHVISQRALGPLVQGRFDTDGDDVSVVESVQPTGLFMNERELREGGATLADVAEFVLDLEKGQLSGDTWPIPTGVSDEPAFLAVFPSRLLDRLPCLPADDG